MEPWVCPRCLSAARTRLRISRKVAGAHQGGCRRLSYTSTSSSPTTSSKSRYQSTQNNVASQRTVIDGTRSRRQKNDELREGHSSSAYSDLPLPPFLRKLPKPPVDERYPSRFSFLPYIGGYKRGNMRTQEQRFRVAPFATVFASNPYAHALATPVRECAFTNMRLPQSCLVDFHLANVPGSTKGEVQFLPLSLAAALVPRAVRRGERGSMTKGEEEAVETWQEEDGGRVPTGNGSYMVAKQEAVDFVSQNPKRRVMQYAVGRRVLMNLDKAGKKGKMMWREDMPQLILVGMRRLVARTLGHFARQKVVADHPGLMQAMPRGAGLDRLDDVDNVQCVLSLRPSATSVESNRNAAEADPGIAVGAESSELVPSKTEATQGLNSRSSDVRDPFDGKPVSMPNVSPDAEDSSTASDLGPIAASKTTVGSTTRFIAEGPWQHEERKSLPFLDGIRPLPAPAKPPTLYYPTVRYRNRRVAAHNLPHLLGEDLAASIIKDTVFEKLTHVVLTGGKSLVDTQNMLLKLQGYLSDVKTRTPRV